jgi:hypothetical protein
MRFRILGFGVVLLLAVTVALATSAAGGARERFAGGPDGSVANWDAVGSTAYSAAALTPAEGHVIFGYLGIAVYDSVIAVQGGWEPFAVDLKAPAGASAEAAVAAAAHAILVHYLPGQAATIVDPAYAAALAGITDGQAKTDGIATGERVATILLALRADDGFRASVTYTPPNPPIPGVWIPTAPTPPVGMYLGLMRPFSIKSADQFRPAGPPALDSETWARDYNEVKDVGSSTSTSRTAAQTLAARFWAEAPVQQAHGAFRKFILDHELNVVDAARLMGMIDVTYADSIIACFDAKYHYRFWRPITAIRAGDTDGNPATAADPSWSPLIGTPNHPEYPSAHACITPGAGRVLASFLGTPRIDFTIPSLTGLGDRRYANAGELEYEVSNARIWGGIHYRSSVEDGAEISKRTVNWVLSHNFHRRGQP